MVESNKLNIIFGYPNESFDYYSWEPFDYYRTNQKINEIIKENHSQIDNIKKSYSDFTTTYKTNFNTTSYSNLDGINILISNIIDTNNQKNFKDEDNELKDNIFPRKQSTQSIIDNLYKEYIKHPFFSGLLNDYETLYNDIDKYNKKFKQYDNSFDKAVIAFVSSKDKYIKENFSKYIDLLKIADNIKIIFEKNNYINIIHFTAVVQLNNYIINTIKKWILYLINRRDIDNPKYDTIYGQIISDGIDKITKTKYIKLDKCKDFNFNIFKLADYLKTLQIIEKNNIIIRDFLKKIYDNKQLLENILYIDIYFKYFSPKNTVNITEFDKQQQKTHALNAKKNFFIYIDDNKQFSFNILEGDYEIYLLIDKIFSNAAFVVDICTTYDYMYGDHQRNTRVKTFDDYIKKHGLSQDEDNKNIDTDVDEKIITKDLINTICIPPNTDYNKTFKIINNEIKNFFDPILNFKTKYITKLDSNYKFPSTLNNQPTQPPKTQPPSQPPSQPSPLQPSKTSSQASSQHADINQQKPTTIIEVNHNMEEAQNKIPQNIQDVQNNNNDELYNIIDLEIYKNKFEVIIENINTLYTQNKQEIENYELFNKFITKIILKIPEFKVNAEKLNFKKIQGGRKYNRYNGGATYTNEDTTYENKIINYMKLYEKDKTIEAIITIYKQLYNEYYKFSPINIPNNTFKIGKIFANDFKNLLLLLDTELSFNICNIVNNNFLSTQLNNINGVSNNIITICNLLIKNEVLNQYLNILDVNININYDDINNNFKTSNTLETIDKIINNFRFLNELNEELKKIYNLIDKLFDVLITKREDKKDVIEYIDVAFSDQLKTEIEKLKNTINTLIYDNKKIETYYEKFYLELNNVYQQLKKLFLNIRVKHADGYYYKIIKQNDNSVFELDKEYKYSTGISNADFSYLLPFNGLNYYGVNNNPDGSSNPWGYQGPPSFGGKLKKGGSNYLSHKDIIVKLFSIYDETTNANEKDKNIDDTGGILSKISKFVKNNITTDERKLRDLEILFTKVTNNHKKNLPITTGQLNEYKKIPEKLDELEKRYEENKTATEDKKTPGALSEYDYRRLKKLKESYTDIKENQGGIEKIEEEYKNKGDLIVHTAKKLVTIEFNKISSMFKILLQILTVVCILIYVVVLTISLINVINLVIKILSSVGKIFYNTVVVNNDTLGFKVKEILKCTKDDYSYDMFNILNEQVTALSVFNSTIYIIYVLIGYVIVYILLVLYTLVFKYTHEFVGNIGDIDPDLTLFSIIMAIFAFSLIHLLIYKMIFKGLALENYKTLNDYEATIDTLIRNEITTKYEINNDYDDKFFNILFDTTKKTELNNLFSDKVLELNEDNSGDIGRFLIIYDIYMFFSEYMYLTDEKQMELRNYFTKQDKSFLSYLDSNDKRLIKLYHQDLDFYNSIPVDKLEYFKPINKNVTEIIARINKYIIKFSGTFYPFLMICVYIIVIFLYNAFCVYTIFEMVHMSKSKNIFPPAVYAVSEQYKKLALYVYNLIFG